MTTRPNRRGDRRNLPIGPVEWYRDAVIYEVHVRAFCDSNGDGIGDFPGLTSKLDYLQELGITAIWLLPFYPSPLKDDGYDIADYTGVHADYGSVGDFQKFLDQAHQRGLRVITELVLNHTSDQHAWFRRARRALPGSSERDFYVWSDTPARYQATRVIFKDFELSNWAWDPVAGAYYWHRFYSHQPDLNYRNPQVLEAVLKVIDFWLSRGVDGLRLDAVPYLVEAEGTSSENLPETHAILRKIRHHIDAHYADRMLLAEANQWPEDAVAYFGAGDEAHMVFHFPLMPRLFMSLRREDTSPIIDIMAQTPAIPPRCQWALFLRNHDELTLEMVTEEERVYMWRAYARDPAARINLGIRRRLAPLLGNDRRRIELMNALLLSMPGTPVVYYGDEIGMGDNIYLGDRNGVRTPMQWDFGPNAGFSEASPQRLYLPLIIDPEYHHLAVHVAAQERNPSSLLHWMQRMFAIRRRYCAFGRGSIRFLPAENPHVLAFLRLHEDERLLVLANLSRFTQRLAVPLAEYKGLEPIDLFGRTALPVVTGDPYQFMLGPHAFHWFSLEEPVSGRLEQRYRGGTWPTVDVEQGWEEAVHGEARTALEDLFPVYLQNQPWFLGKDRTILACRVDLAIPVARDHTLHDGYLLLLRVEYSWGDPETYLFPLGYAAGARKAAIEKAASNAVVARLRRRNERSARGILYDAMYDPALATALLDVILPRRQRAARAHELEAVLTDAAREFRRIEATDLKVTGLRPGESVSAASMGDRLYLKLLRCVDAGPDPAWEIGSFLTERGYPNAPRMLGVLRHIGDYREPFALVLLESFVPNQGTLLQHAIESLNACCDRMAGVEPVGAEPTLTPSSLLQALAAETPDRAGEYIGPFLEIARLLGRRLAELHRVLASDPDLPGFAPEAFTEFYQRALLQKLRSLVMATFEQLEQSAPSFDGTIGATAHRLLDRREDLLCRFDVLRTRTLPAIRIRGHGSCTLDRVLVSGDDLAFVGFEGDFQLPLYERRLKRSPLLDVAFMMRSIRGVAATAAGSRTQGAGGAKASCATYWRYWVSVAFLQSYVREVGEVGLVPGEPDFALLLELFLCERVVQELCDGLGKQDPSIGASISDLLDLIETTGCASE